jgi:hypothetical protein
MANSVIRSTLRSDEGAKILKKQNNLNIKFDASRSWDNKGCNLCAGCRQPIIGQVITALGFLWHPEHFVCFNCNRKIGTNIFYEKDQRPYCENDYIELFSPKCSACTKPILDVCLFLLYTISII